MPRAITIGTYAILAVGAWFIYAGLFGEPTSRLKDLFLNAGTELVGIVVTVWVIDALNDLRLSKEYDLALVRSLQTASYVKHAIGELRHKGKLLTALRGAYLANVILSGENLTDVDCGDADMTGAKLVGTRLFRANLAGAILTDVDFSNADLTGADLRGALISNTLFDSNTKVAGMLVYSSQGDSDLQELFRVGRATIASPPTARR